MCSFRGLRLPGAAAGRAAQIVKMIFVVANSDARYLSLAQYASDSFELASSRDNERYRR